ncbi:MAG: shikimate kinase [Intestinimonas sp.]
MKNIILIGMMGCGKTTCGGLLSRRLDRELVDTDALIAAREGRSIPEIFAAQGEDRFRELERGVAEELARREGLVVGLRRRPAPAGRRHGSPQVQRHRGLSVP